MNSRSSDSDQSSTASEAMRAALERQLSDASSGGAHEAPPAVPDHTLLQRVGRGAYGEVWLARNALGTFRAVKVVYRERFEDDRPYEREFNGILKYEPISRSHEGLVQVLHVGRNDAAGCFYYVMEAADDAATEEEQRGKGAGGNLSLAPFLLCSSAHYSPRTLRSELARRQRLPPADAAQLTLRLNAALGFLHGHGLVHRDVKPSNVIFVGGQPKLADIGLVTRAGDSRSFVGTEGFVPPEGPGTPEADLYGLGKLLYELTTGRDRMDFPQLPPGVTRLPDGEAILELNEVVTRACAPGPKQRYARAAEMAADLNLFLSGRSLRRERNFERHVARLKRIALVACGCLVLAAVVVGLALNEQRRANERASTEAILRGRAEKAERERTAQLYTALFGEARATVRSAELGQRVRALEALQRAAAISNTAELRREAVAALTLPDLRFERELPAGGDATFTELDPGFERYAVCRGGGPMEIRAVTDNRLLALLPASSSFPAYYGKWSPDGRFLAFKRDRQQQGLRADVEAWEVADARRILLVTNLTLGAMAFHPHQSWLLTGQEAEVSLWNLETGQELKRFELPGTAPHRLLFSPDGERFAALWNSAKQHAVSVNRTSDGSALTLYEIAEQLLDMAWDPTGKWLATADQSGSVHVVDSRSGEARLLGRHKAQAARVAFHPDGRYLFSGGWERELICWDLRTMQRAFGVALGSFDLRLRADGRECALVVEVPKRLLLHAFEAPAAHREFTEDLGSRVYGAALSPDGRWLAAAGAERFGVWDLSNRSAAALAKGTLDTRFNFSMNGELFVQRRGDCSRWRVSPATNSSMPPTLERLQMATGPNFVSLSLLPDSAVLTLSTWSRITSWDQLPSLQGEWKATEWKPTVDGFSGLSPDGRWMGMRREYRPELFVYRLPSLEPVAVLTNGYRIQSFHFSPRGDEVAATSRLGIEFWSTTGWQRTRVVTNFTDLLYAPDARSLWLTKDYSAAGLYDAQTLQPLLTLPAGTVPLALSPDGRRLAVSVDLRRLQVWDLEELRKQLRELGLDWAGAK